MKGSLRLLLAAPVAIAMLAACSSSSGTSSLSSSTSGSQAGSKPAPPKITIGYVDVSATVGEEPQVYSVIKAGAAKLGWSVSLSDAQNSPTKALQETESFIDQGVSALIFANVPGAFVGSALQLAKQKHIPTINLVTNSPGAAYDSQVVGTQTVASLAPLIANMKSTLGRGAQVGILELAVVLEGSPEAIAVQNAISAAGFKIDEIEYPNIATIAQTEPASVSSMVRAHPDIKAIVDIAGLVSLDVAGLKEAKNSTTKLYGFDVDSATVPTLVEPDSPLVALLYANHAETAAIALNELVRYFGPDKTPLTPQIEVASSKMYTAANLPAALKANPGSNALPVSPDTILAPYFTKWAQQWTLK